MIQLFNQDCMVAMKDMRDKQYDLCICDPPYSPKCNLYGGSSSDAKNGWGKLWATNKHFQWNTRPPTTYFSELLRVSVNQIIWGGNYFINDLYDTPCIIIWDKGQRNFSLADAEIAWSSFLKPVRIFTHSRSLNNRTDRIHINQKPIALYKWLLNNYAKPDDKILDTHGGSMSIAIAAYDLGFDLDLYEIDKEYFEAGRARVEKHMSQGQLYLPKKQELKVQGTLL